MALLLVLDRSFENRTSEDSLQSLTEHIAMAHSASSIRTQILSALHHPEAEEGLYFRNFYQLHEEDERDPVRGTQVEILDALKDLIAEGMVIADDSGPELVFHLRTEERTSL